MTTDCIRQRVRRRVTGRRLESDRGSKREAVSQRIREGQTQRIKRGRRVTGQRIGLDNNRGSDEEDGSVGSVLEKVRGSDRFKSF